MRGIGWGAAALALLLAAGPGMAEQGKGHSHEHGHDHSHGDPQQAQIEKGYFEDAQVAAGRCRTGRATGSRSIRCCRTARWTR